MLPCFNTHVLKQLGEKMSLEIRRNTFVLKFSKGILPLIQMLVVVLLAWQPFKEYTHINIINVNFDCVCAIKTVPSRAGMCAPRTHCHG